MAAARGRYGDGAVYQTDDGAWRGTVDLGRDPTTGRRIRKYVRCKTRGEAIKKIAALRDKHRAGELTVQSRRSLTLAEWLDQWLAGPAKLRLGEDMQRRYAQICRDHIKPTLGSWPIDRLTPEAVEQLYSDLAAKGQSPRSVVFVHRILGRAIKVANQRGYVNRNVVRLVELETPHGRRGVALKADEARRVLATSRAWRDHARWVVALGLGARQSEVLGMRWTDLDLDEGLWRVGGQLRHRPWQHGCENGSCGRRPDHCPERHGGGFYLKGTAKTEAGNRLVPLAPFVIDALREHRATQDAVRASSDDMWTDEPISGLVFTTPFGTPVGHRNDHSRWRRLLAEAGVRQVRLHDARHTTITLLAQAGVPRDIIALVVGHDDPAFTER
ncbi:MAG TPA: site-specific integrase, partial [Pengzhenrongella sp.]